MTPYVEKISSTWSLVTFLVNLDTTTLVISGDLDLDFRGCGLLTGLLLLEGVRLLLVIGDLLLPRLLSPPLRLLGE